MRGEACYRLLVSDDDATVTAHITVLDGCADSPVPLVPGERRNPVAYRAFLLYLLAGGATASRLNDRPGEGARAPGSPEQRLSVAVSSACDGATSRAVRAWRNRFQWRERADALGPGADLLAWEVYRATYLGPTRGAELVALAADPAAPRPAPGEHVPVLHQLDAESLSAELSALGVPGPLRPVLARPEPMPPTPRYKHTPRVIEDAVPVAAAMPDQQPLTPVQVGKRVAAAVIKASEDARAAADRERETGERLRLTADEARNILRDLGLHGPLDPGTLRATDRELLDAARKVGPEAEGRVLALIATERAQQAQQHAGLSNDRLLNLVDASIGVFARELGNGNVKVTMASLPMLIKTRQLITGQATERREHTGLLDGRLPESARVTEARRASRDDPRAIVAAWRDDVREIAVVLDALGEVVPPAASAPAADEASGK